ncbi:MAG: glycosyltransferase family 39 protein [Oscillochloridaceae bacterium]|nr:glycosyltransferase family 39 protein [Chloroflexaceae bacterium]MDW8389988.1 glycosyltransferase family 39 protein [Oscillochloridaceae bacterium]
MNQARRLPPDILPLALITLAGLGLRLLVWRWREFQPLGGDEQEYFNAALILLREWRYQELLFMRPPIYPLFLATSIVLVDSLVQNLRLVQALVSTATIPVVYLLSREVALALDRPPVPARRAGLAAALLAALSYTLAANATELLAETLFLFALTASFWLLVRAGRHSAAWRASVAGMAVGLASLVRSMALPLLPLGGLWLLIGRGGATWRRAAVFVLAGFLVILPWTFRNYLVYGGLILIDTTGAENLWLDNDPAGREAVKAQLFALGEDQLARQQLAAREGWAAIRDDPARFAAKAWGELLQFFALEYADDMRARPQIWVRPADVWLRLILGDGLWLLLALAGSYGLARGLLQPGAGGGWRDVWGSPARGEEKLPRARRLKPRATVGEADLRRLPQATQAAFARLAGPCTRPAAQGGAARAERFATPSPAWLLAPWALYVVLTTLVFHVELRYRLPLYPALLPFAGLTLTGQSAPSAARHAPHPGASRPATPQAPGAAPGATSALVQTGGGQRTNGARPSLHGFVALLAPFAVLTLTLLHVNYVALGWQLGLKHWRLARAEAALERGDAAAARRAASAALERDEDSALARIALARADLLSGDLPAALAHLDDAVAVLPDHPQARVLRGDVRRALGDPGGARADLAYETASLQDLQRWLWERGITPPPARLPLGNGLDLGFIAGFHGPRPGEEGFRWTTGTARVRLSNARDVREVRLRLASGRPAGAAPVTVTLWAGSTLVGQAEIGPEWSEHTFTLPAGTVTGDELVLELRAPTFTPREFDRASPDGRRLGVKLAAVEVG